jgi:APA family basic amino acid/polyamine antiporter
MASGRQFVKGLGLLDSTMIVAGSMIGSGIFIVSADMARQIGSPGWLLVVWLLTGILTVCAALSYGELAAMMPRAGGQYRYLREAYGPVVGFLYGWTLFTVIQTGTIAAVAVAFAKFLGVLLPTVSATTPLIAMGPLQVTTQQAAAITVIVSLSLVNLRGIQTAKLIQNVFTIAKLGALLGLIFLGLGLGSRGFSAFQAPDFWTPVVSGQSLGAWGLLTALCVAMVGSLFSADAWNNITFTAAEVKDPKRVIPLSLALGTGIVIGLYLLANLAYLSGLSWDSIMHAPEDRVGTALALATLGKAGAGLMAGAILISTFGCVNGLIMAGGRAFFAMAEDRLFFKSAGQLNAQGVPAWAIAIQALWACGLTLSGSYGNLLDYVIFAALLFYVLTVASVFVFRRRQPDAPRPYKAWGYPVIPAFYIVTASLIMLSLLAFKPNFTWPGLGLVLLGLPVYLVWRKVTPQTSPVA